MEQIMATDAMSELFREGGEEASVLMWPCLTVRRIFFKERVDSLTHRKWRETKQQPSMLPGLAVLGCYYN